MEATQLTNLQKELLKTFNYNLSESELNEIKNLLAKYFAEKATQEIDQEWEENKWSKNTMDSWLNEHLRSSSSK